MKISLIIPAHNEEKYIGACLDAVMKNAPDKFFEIIVIDNASTDKTAEITRTYKGVRVVREGKKGLTKARERGRLEATGDILAYTDADTEMPKGWFEKALKEFANPKTVCLSGPYIYFDIPKWQSLLVLIYWNILALPIYYIVGYMVVGGNFAIRKDTLEKMSGFDTSIEFYGEDTNIARRASQFGKVKFKPNFLMQTSGRRLKGQGFFRTANIYATNFFSEVFMKRPVTKKYKDIR